MSELTPEERAEIFYRAAQAAANLNPEPHFKVIGQADNATRPPIPQDDPEVAGVLHPNHPSKR